MHDALVSRRALIPIAQHLGVPRFMIASGRTMINGAGERHGSPHRPNWHDIPLYAMRTGGVSRCKWIVASHDTPAVKLHVPGCCRVCGMRTNVNETRANTATFQSHPSQVAQVSHEL